MVEIKFKWGIEDTNGLKLPGYKTKGSACLDIMAAEDSFLYQKQRKTISTGFSMEIPEGYYVEIFIRSGIAAKHGITLINGTGIIDSDYRGIIKLPLINLSINPKPFEINKGDRICQMAIKKRIKICPILNNELSKTDRNQGGFGSTGK